jgi:hypothetical protein
MAKDAVVFIWDHPILTIFLVIGFILLVWGLLYGLRYMIKPSTWTGKSKTGGGEEQPSIFTAIAAGGLLLSVGFIVYHAVCLHREHGLIGEGFERMSRQIDNAISTIRDRGRELHTALNSLNDSILEGHAGLLTTSGSSASLAYARALEHASKATAELDQRSKQFDELYIEQLNMLLRGHPEVLVKAAKPSLSPDEFQACLLYQHLLSHLDDLLTTIKVGSLELQKYLRRAKKQLPDMDIEAREIQTAIEKDIATSLRKDASQHLLADVDVVEFEGILDKIREETAEKVEKMGRKIRWLAFQGLVCAIVAVIAALLAIIMNRYKFPALGMLAVAIFVGILVINWVGNGKVNDLSRGLTNTCQAFRGAEDMELAKIEGTAIKASTVKKLFDAVDSGGNILQAAQEAFANSHKGGKLFNNQVEIRDSNLFIFKSNGGKEQHPFPINPSDISSFYRAGYAASLKESVSGGQRLTNLLEDLKSNAHMCADAAQLEFPRQWHAALQYLPQILEWMGHIIESTEKVRYRPEIRIWGTMIRHDRQPLLETHGFAKVVISLSETLAKACSAQLVALAQIRDAAERPATSPIRLDAFGKKSENLLKPILDGSFVIQPVKVCVLETCNLAEEAPKLQSRYRWIYIAYVVSIVLALVLCKVLNILARGLFFICPCLEVTRILK